MSKQNKAKEEVQEVQYFMKDKFFDKSEIGVKNIGDKDPKKYSVPVDYKRLHVGNVECVFTKDKALTREEVALFNDYQKEFYLEVRN